MAVIEQKNLTSQEVDGSPAQIWTELDCLATEIFGSNNLAFFAARFEEINTAMSSAGVPELPGFKSPIAECEHIPQHSTPHTTHHTLI